MQNTFFDRPVCTKKFISKNSKLTLFLYLPPQMIRTCHKSNANNEQKKNNYERCIWISTVFEIQSIISYDFVEDEILYMWTHLCTDNYQKFTSIFQGYISKEHRNFGYNWSFSKPFYLQTNIPKTNRHIYPDHQTSDLSKRHFESHL